MMQQFFFLSHVPPNSLQSFFPPANFWQIEPSFLTIPHTPLSAATNTPILEMIVLAVTVIIRFFTDIIYTNCEFSCNLRVSASQELPFKQWCWYCLVDCRLSWWREKNKQQVLCSTCCFMFYWGRDISIILSLILPSSLYHATVVFCPPLMADAWT